MSPLAVLLRVLLCLALILNGSVPVVHAALASTQATPAADHASGMAMNAAENGGGCHDDAMAHAPAPAEAPPAPDHDSGCCGDDGDCRSTCAQHCALSIPGVALLDLTLPPAAGPLPTLVAAHPAPRLRDRIRPPIA